MKKSFICVLSTLLGSVAGACVVDYLKNKELSKEKEVKNRFNTYYSMLNQWLLKKNEGKSLEQYFIDEGYSNIAIYGMGEMGIRLYEELKNTSINVKYYIDKNCDNVFVENIDVYSLESDLEAVDVIVVSPIYNFDEIEKEIRDFVDYNVVSLEEVVNEL